MRKVLVYIDERSELPVREALEDLYAPYNDVSFVFFHVSLFGNDDALSPYRDWANQVDVPATFISRGLQAMSNMATNDEIGMLLVKYGKENDVDQIIVPSENNSSFHRLLYGDTEQYVTDNALWPVTVIPTGVLEVQDGAVGQYAGHLPPEGPS